jgi:hypothetical protein
MVDSPNGLTADANADGSIGALTCTVFLTRDSVANAPLDIDEFKDLAVSTR